MPETDQQTSRQATEDYERMTTLIVDATDPRPAEHSSSDTGLHSMSGPPLATADWVVASWQRAVNDRRVKTVPQDARAGS